MFEMFQLDFMVQAFLALVVTSLLLAYLGVHVVNRGIVFVDLALGQISMLGVAIGAFMGYTGNEIPIAFTLVGAFLMSLIQIKDKRLKHEAIIGIFYAFASALTVLFISKTPHGDADIQEVLFGSVLAVSPAELKTITWIFLAIAIVHAVFIKRFLRLTESLGKGERFKLLDPWNLLFFLSIGLAIVYAVRINGVIPVFSFLIIPAVCGIFLFKNNWLVILLALLLSVLAGFLGLNLSFHYDFPAGASVVSVLGGLFVLSWIGHVIKGRSG